MRLCGDYGHRTRSGILCGYRLANGEIVCPHHNKDKNRQRAMLSKAMIARQQAALPDTIQTNDFGTIDDCLRVRAQVTEILCTAKQPDYRRLDMILKATTGASNDHATKEVKRQNELLLMLDGKGLGVAALQKLRDSPLRVLPGKRSPSEGPNLNNSRMVHDLPD